MTQDLVDNNQYPNQFERFFLHLNVYLEVKEGLAEPVMHDGYLSCVVVEFLPDELRDERLDQQAAAEHGQVVSAEQQ